MSRAEGKDKYIAKKALIEARKDQYVIKDAFKPPILVHTFTHYDYHIKYHCDVWVDPNGDVQSEGVSLTNPNVCSAILCNYSKLKETA